MIRVKKKWQLKRKNASSDNCEIYQFESDSFNPNRLIYKVWEEGSKDTPLASTVDVEIARNYWDWLINKGGAHLILEEELED